MLACGDERWSGQYQCLIGQPIKGNPMQRQRQWLGCDGFGDGGSSHSLTLEAGGAYQNALADMFSCRPICPNLQQQVVIWGGWRRWEPLRGNATCRQCDSDSSWLSTWLAGPRRRQNAVVQWAVQVVCRCFPALIGAGFAWSINHLQSHFLKYLKKISKVRSVYSAYFFNTRFCVFLESSCVFCIFVQKYSKFRKIAYSLHFGVLCLTHFLHSPA